MCGRYVTPDTQSIKDWWKGELISDGQFPFHYNAAPTVQVPVIHSIPERGNELCLARWGFIPHWWKEAPMAFSASMTVANLVHEKILMMTIL